MLGSRETQPRKFTLIELLVVIAIIAILASLLLPALKGAREKALQANCQAHMKQVCMAVSMYIDDNDDWVPKEIGTYGTTPWIFWPHQLIQYVEFWDIFQCPANPYSKGVNEVYWGMNYPLHPTMSLGCCFWKNTPAPPAVPYITRMRQVQNPHAKFLVGDSNHEAVGGISGMLCATACGQWGCNTNSAVTHIWFVPHKGGVDVGYVDGHVAWMDGYGVWSKWYGHNAGNPTLP